MVLGYKRMRICTIENLRNVILDDFAAIAACSKRYFWSIFAAKRAFQPRSSSSLREKQEYRVVKLHENSVA
jgi:hypothetical protein